MTTATAQQPSQLGRARPLHSSGLSQYCCLPSPHPVPPKVSRGSNMHRAVISYDNGVSSGIPPEGPTWGFSWGDVTLFRKHLDVTMAATSLGGGKFSAHLQSYCTAIAYAVCQTSLCRAWLYFYCLIYFPCRILPFSLVFPCCLIYLIFLLKGKKS